jgi:hypothetical protein
MMAPLVKQPMATTPGVNLDQVVTIEPKKKVLSSTL